MSGPEPTTGHPRLLCSAAAIRHDPSDYQTPATVGHISLSDRSMEEVAEYLLEKDRNAATDLSERSPAVMGGRTVARGLPSLPVWVTSTRCG